MPVEVFQLDLHLFSQFQIERAQRFIQQQHRGFIDQRTRNGNALTLAARKLRRLARNGKAQPDLSSASCASAWRFSCRCLDHQPVSDVIENRHMRKQRVVSNTVLTSRSHGGSSLASLPKIVIVPPELFKTGDQPKAGGFAGARRPQHGEKLPVTNGNAHPIHRPYVAVQTETSLNSTAYVMFCSRMINGHP